VLVGLQLHPILTGVSGSSAAVLLGQAALVSAVVIAVRIAWGFSVPYLVRALDRRPAQRVRRVGAPRRFLVADTIRRNSIQDVRIDDHLRIGRGRRGEHARHTTAAILRPGGPPAITRSG
jgi:hypothetical protein